MPKACVAGIAAALLSAAGIALLVAAPSSAYISGGCHATLNGTSLDTLGLSPSDAVIVGKDDVVPMTMNGPAGKRFSELHIALAFVGQSWNVYDASASGGTWSHDIDVHSFARYGVGLYRLEGVGTFSDGSDVCSGIALVRVTGDPLTTVAGIASAAATGVGVLSVLGAGIAAGGGGGGGSGPGGSVTQQDVTAEEKRRRDEDELGDILEGVTDAPRGWCFLFALLALPFMLLIGTSASLMAIAAPAVRIKRRSWPLVVGPLGGLLTGAGAGVLLQEYAVIYPTRTWGIVYLAGGIAFGLAVPMLRRALSR